MRRGCIVIGEIVCDNCHRIMEHGEQYLVIEEKEDEKLRICLGCCLDKGYASYVMEKGNQVLTFFPSKQDSE